MKPTGAPLSNRAEMFRLIKQPLSWLADPKNSTVASRDIFKLRRHDGAIYVEWK